jgi:hypothetical protein
MTTVACLLDGLALALLLAHWPAVRGTTLVGPWGWLGLSLVVLPFAPGAGMTWRLLAAALALCPAMSLLGAKRPQDKAWHFIVATFWLILALPALQAITLGKEGEMDAHPARSWFLAVTIVFSVLNSLFSRYWLCVLLAGIGQGLLLSPYLPWPLSALANEPDTGLACYAAGVVIAAVLGQVPRQPAAPLDRLWRDFRDAYGLVWTLRVAERINHTAAKNGWDVAVGVRGFRSPTEGQPAVTLNVEQQHAFHQSLFNLLRRFVSPEWISRRASISIPG